MRAAPDPALDPGLLDDLAVVHVESAVRRMAADLLRCCASSQSRKPGSRRPRRRAGSPAFPRCRACAWPRRSRRARRRAASRTSGSSSGSRSMARPAESDRQHLRRCRTAAPVAGDERALQPDIVPEAVRGLLLHFHLDAGLRGLAWNSAAMSTAPLNAASATCRATRVGRARPS